MSQAEELLNSIGDDTLGVMLLGTEMPMQEPEEHIIIDSNRYVRVPEALRRIAVQYDHDIETVTFDCPRYWDGHDLSKMKIYINYMRSDRYVGCYLTTGATIDAEDDTIMHFDWVLSQNATAAKGALSFLVCVKTVDESGIEQNHWNSELNREMYVSEGLECTDPVHDLQPDIVAAILTRVDYVEGLVSPDVLAGYINYYLNNNPDVVDAALKGMVTSEAIQGYVDNYLDEHGTVLDDYVTKANANVYGHLSLAFPSYTGAGSVEYSHGEISLSAINTDETQCAMLSVDRNVDNLSDILKLKTLDLESGSETEYRVYHEGNLPNINSSKPSGQYTGDGSETERIIDTGSTGNVIIIWHAAGMTIVAGKSTMYFTSSDGVKWTLGFIEFSNGVLKFASSESHINYNNRTYYYQVL